jgi:hypothetical protein
VELGNFFLSVGSGTVFFACFETFTLEVKVSSSGGGTASCVFGGSKRLLVGNFSFFGEIGGSFGVGASRFSVGSSSVQGGSFGFFVGTAGFGSFVGSPFEFTGSFGMTCRKYLEVLTKAVEFFDVNSMSLGSAGMAGGLAFSGGNLLLQRSPSLLYRSWPVISVSIGCEHREKRLFSLSIDITFSIERADSGNK